MKIAVSDNGNEGKRKKYLDWLQLFAPDAELTVIGYTNGFASLKGFDGLVLTGGEDIDPQLSKALPIELVQPSDKRRDDFEFQLLEQAITEKKPILGICRGLQVTNVFLGGSLTADLQSAGFADHTTKKNENERRHSIAVTKESLMYSVVGAELGEINSYHHQSALNVADDLMVSGRSPDGVIESLEWKNKTNKSFLLLVQWHPERMIDVENPFTRNICKAFFRAAKK
ncbi:MAG: gamma-glutamyl-gamma-aminobutyrate hydrolase family protein [Bacteroidota bacterium]|nr:gamma-glutamyl-gamma-aminobutyrate hydrolase family protein [Bacteroidota bacterium]